ncbi:MAG TPA: TetR/AcrR family transcriptional regulator [Myxococcota bacterium]
MSDPSRSSASPKSEPYAELEPRALPVQKRAKDTVGLILETAAELVDEVGVIAFTTNLLAQRAGIRIRTIYRYFPNKVGILRALLLHLNQESDAQMGPFALLADRERDWRGLVDFWVDDLTAWSRNRPGARLIMGWAYAIPELLVEQERLNKSWTQDMMRALRERGLQIPDKQLYAVCRTFIEMLDTLSILTSTHIDEHSDDIVEEQRLGLKAYLTTYLD